MSTSNDSNRNADGNSKRLYSSIQQVPRIILRFTVVGFNPLHCVDNSQRNPSTYLRLLLPKYQLPRVISRMMALRPTTNPFILRPNLPHAAPLTVGGFALVQRSGRRGQGGCFIRPSPAGRRE